MCINMKVTINLQETETMWLLGMPSVWVDINSEEASGVVEEIKHYKQVREKSYKLALDGPFACVIMFVLISVVTESCGK